MDHVFIEVENKRWCLCCDLFQKKGPDMAFFPTPTKPCPNDVPAADPNRIAQQKK